MRADCSTLFRYKRVAFRRVPLPLRAEWNSRLFQSIPWPSRVHLFEASAGVPSDVRGFGVMPPLSELARSRAERLRKRAVSNKRTTDLIP